MKPILRKTTTFSDYKVKSHLDRDLFVQEPVIENVEENAENISEEDEMAEVDSSAKESASTPLH